jgi:hypothetical protein
MDQRTFPRPFGSNCDVGAFEAQPTGRLILEKFSIPSGGTDFLFSGENFPFGCEFALAFSLDDGQVESCILPLGQYTITDVVTQNAGVSILPARNSRLIRPLTA